MLVTYKHVGPGAGDILIEIGIDPVAFTVGSMSVRWYDIMVIAAGLTVVAWAVYAARKVKFSTNLIYTLAIWGAVGGLIGARLDNIIDELNFYIQNPAQILGFDGLAIYGAILGATLAIWIASRVYKFQFGPFLDMMAPGALLGMAVGRIGCTINGCCYGAPTTLPWGLVYTNPNSMAPFGTPTQPAVVYEMLFDLVLFFIVWKLRDKLRPAGSLFLFFLALFVWALLYRIVPRPGVAGSAVLWLVNAGADNCSASPACHRSIAHSPYQMGKIFQRWRAPQS